MENRKPNSRREFLKKGSGICLGLGALCKAPFVYSKNKYTIRVLGTHVTLQEELRQKAMDDLGINIVFEPGGSAEVLYRASVRPESFDLYEQWSNSINVLWQALPYKRLKLPVYAIGMM